MKQTKREMKILSINIIRPEIWVIYDLSQQFSSIFTLEYYIQAKATHALHINMTGWVCLIAFAADRHRVCEYWWAKRRQFTILS